MDIKRLTRRRLAVGAAAYDIMVGTSYSSRAAGTQPPLRTGRFVLGRQCGAGALG